MFTKIKEKFRKIPTPFRQILFVLLIIILSPLIILLALELLMQTFHLPYKINSYLTKKSYSRDVSVTFIYKGEEYKINATEKCINRGVSFSTGNMKWHTVWDNTWENDVITTKGKDIIKLSKTIFYNKKDVQINLEDYAREYCGIILDPAILTYSVSNYKKMPNSITFAIPRLIRVTDVGFGFEEIPNVKITSISLGEIKPLPTKFFNSYFDD